MNTFPIVRCHRTLSRLVVVPENLRAIALIGDANGKITLLFVSCNMRVYLLFAMSRIQSR